jgi:GNAT superfamily N-acetyltransferase
MSERPFAGPERTIRVAVAADAAVLGRMRAAQQIELDGPVSPAEAEAYASACVAFFARELAAPEPWVFGWIAESAGVPVGAAVLTVAPGMPRLGAAGCGPDGRIRNVYVTEHARRRGIARELTHAAIAASERLGVARLVLGASVAGRNVYAKLGFVEKSDEMVYRGATAGAIADPA